MKLLVLVQLKIPNICKQMDMPESVSHMHQGNASNEGRNLPTADATLESNVPSRPNKRRKTKVGALFGTCHQWPKS